MKYQVRLNNGATIAVDAKGFKSIGHETVMFFNYLNEEDAVFYSVSYVLPVREETKYPTTLPSLGR